MKTDVPSKLIKDMKESREQLRRNKPKVYVKLTKYLQAEKEGRETAMSLVDFAFDFRCNFSCSHCCARILRRLPTQRGMSVNDVKVAADQVDKAGVFIFNLIGGEPLIWWPQFQDIINAIDPSRFYVSITTNGWLMTPQKARRLKELGVDKVGVSIDSGIGGEHDKFRNRPGSFKRAISAVKSAQAAGLRTIISTVVTHQNVHADGFKRILEIAQKFNTGLDLQCATVSGAWTGNMEALIDDDDAKYLEELRKKYPLLRRDVWSTPGSKGGCPASTRSLYIIPSGDVLPCLFIHVSFGNVLKESLATIQKRMMEVRELREFSPICLAGEDRNFISSYLATTFGKETLPLDYRDVFNKKSKNTKRTGKKYEK